MTAKVSKDLGAFIPVALILKLWDLLYFPFHQLTKNKNRRFMESLTPTAQRIRYSKDSVLVIPPPARNHITDFIESKDFDGTLNGLLKWVHGGYEDRPCMGQRKVLGHQEGHDMNGKPVNMISQSDEYQRLTHAEVQRRVLTVATGIQGMVIK